jgi:hypothetical protein
VSGFLLAPPGVVTINEGGKEPVRVALREQRDYDRLASALSEALAKPIDVVETRGAADAFPQLIPAIVADDIVAPDRTILLDASPSDLVDVVRRGMLGALTAEGLGRWRAGEPVGQRDLLARAVIAEKMDAIVTTPHPGGYAYVSSGLSLPALLAAYLRNVP